MNKTDFLKDQIELITILNEKQKMQEKSSKRFKIIHTCYV